MPQLQASIIINNYNYAAYLEEAIDSALNQTYSAREVIVVDDGSSDSSREVLRRYENDVQVVLKENGGQASAFNAGFEVSLGDVVFFLDADDAFLPRLVEEAVALFRESEVVKVHWPLHIIDATGKDTDEILDPDLPEGDFRETVRRYGPMNELTWPSPPTSGNAYSRNFLRAVLPMPETPYRLYADAYLFGLAPAFGVLRRLQVPQALYRRHGSNAYDSRAGFAEKLAMGLSDFEQQAAFLARHYQRAGLPFETSVWRGRAWWPRIQESLDEIFAIAPPGEALILIDDDAWGTDDVIFGRPRFPFPERCGVSWGPPADDAEAVGELERLREQGARYLVFAWPAFWWLECYADFVAYCRQSFPCRLQNDRVLIYDLGA
ncbi:MAG: glycosyltransferase family 2 protein [Nitriliruptorales bacterium]